MGLLTFHEFLHNDAWKRPLKAGEENKVIDLIAHAGPQGITRCQLGAQVDLPVKVLDELLAMMSRNGWVSVAWDGANTVYRAVR